jgi:hypothetical protein
MSSALTRRTRTATLTGAVSKSALAGTFIACRMADQTTAKADLIGPTKTTTPETP